MDARPSAMSATEAQGFTPQYRTYVLAILTMVYAVNYVDRQILSILLQPIKEELLLTDTQLGFISGIVFAIFYATLGIPIAMVADRSNRRNVITVAMTLFSGFTAACAGVTSFLQLAAMRIGVAVGEAGSSPPSHSMIADMYPPEKRGGALGVFSLGVNIGILIGFLLGGWVSQWFGWRAAFLVAGVPGLFLAVLVRMTVREPLRGHAEAMVDSGNAPGVMEVFRFMWGQRSFRHLAFGGALAAFVGYGAVVWLPAFLARSYSLDQATIGTSLALIIGISGGLGTYLGGWMGDRFGRHDVRWNLWCVVIIWVAIAPFNIALYLSSDPIWALGLFIVPAFAGAAYLAPMLSMTQSLVTLRMRSVASAILLFILNIIGLGLGPQTVGFVSDLLRPQFGVESLRYALLFTSFVGLWGAFHIFMATRTLKEDIERARVYGQI